jgi:hypothetical protein
MRKNLALAFGLVGLLAASPAFPCGAGFGPGIEIVPQQYIIVVYKEGVETYVFQPTFCGTASDFGLILPVPALLTQNPFLSDQQAFTTANALSEPKKVTVKDGGGCMPLAGGSAAGGTRASDSGASVVASGHVGFLDWVQLKADTEASFTDWLTANGYPYSTTSSSVFTYYVQKGWYFLAFRISQGVAPDGGTLCTALGPVRFSFPSSVPVVPSRMASAGTTVGSSYSQQFTWRILGITRGDTQLEFSDMASANVLDYSGAIKASDVPSLAGLAEAGDRLTRLTLSFSSGDPADVGLTLAPPGDYRATEYVHVPSDSSYSVTKTSTSGNSFLLPLLGLALGGLFCWRRWRQGSIPYFTRVARILKASKRN